jgi:hypothetical protein
MTIYSIVYKLIGQISPIGEHNADTERLDNLREHIFLVEQMIRDIKEVSRYKTRPEASMKKLGEKAQHFLETYKIEN